MKDILKAQEEEKTRKKDSRWILNDLDLKQGESDWSQKDWWLLKKFKSAVININFVHMKTNNHY